ncbi:hypothetical protein ACH4UM_31875 [Streptomyces sp. NPDC020801]|uniref:hypothetical protein n=1 Tax=unclassified Streptomyces TaxID=2593676 RepID=UPI00378AED4E
MARISNPRRFVMLTASTVLAAGGALVPASAFAAPQTAHAVTAGAVADGGHWRHHDGGHWRHGGGDDRDGRGGGGQGNVVVIIGNGNTVPVNNGTVNTG